MALADNIRILSLHEPPAGDAARNPPGLDAVNARNLDVANTAESIGVPATEPTAAYFVRLAVTDDTYVHFTGTAAVPGDVTDGTASELLPAKSVSWFYIRGVTNISVVSLVAAARVTASFYK
jgi:hypothetical protein